MSGFDGRTKGKRIRKPQAGNSNAKARWKYLSADVTDVVDKPVAKLQAKARRKAIAKSVEKKALKVGYDIDGDGFVDVREMRLAKFLDAMLLDRRKDADEGPKLSETELLAMRQSAGRLLIAKEFVERNHERLWRYGAIFTGMTDEQAAEFIARHKNFKKLMPFLESTERNRVVRSSHQMRSCIHGEVIAGAPPNASSERQTWVETTRKLRSSSFTKHPLPALQPKKKPVSPSLDLNQVDLALMSSLAVSASSPEVFSNAYGAIDIDGDGIVDDDEMKLHLRLQEATQSGDHDNNRDETRGRHVQQFEGRKMMVADFVQRNAGQMWLYDASFRHKSTEQIVDEIASGVGFAAEFNRLRAKERLVKLKSSLGVSSCIVQLPLAALPTDPSNALEFRRVRDRPELLAARKELLKPLPQRRAPRGIREEIAASGAVVGRSRSEGSLLIGLPRIYDTPIQIETIGSFSVTKWLLDN
jgi:Ca2+-binding EF-hand superfamily protein